MELSKYFMGIALLCEKRSKDPSRQVGACIVNTNNQVIATGYNGAPMNCHDCLIPWKKENDSQTVGKELNELESSGHKEKEIGKVNKEEKENKKSKEKQTHPKHDFVCHAELNAIVNKDPKSVEGCTVYVTLFPCNECAKVIVRSGIAKVVYLSDERAEEKIFKASRDILENNRKGALEKFSDILPAEQEKVFKYVLNFKADSKDTKEKLSKNQTKEEKQQSEKETIGWKKYFMALAKLSAEIPSIPDAKQGACIVNKDKRIVGLGYVQDMMQPTIDQQGQENGASSSGESKDEQKAYDPNLTVCHAPVSAIVNKNPSSLRDCTMYVTHYPCKECAKVIVQSGIHKVIYLSEEENHQPNGCRFVNPRHEEAAGKPQDQTVDPTTKMFAVAHIKFKKYKISGNAGNKRKLENELTVVLDYAEVLPNQSPQQSKRTKCESD